MFGFNFQVGALLWALPLASVPILLHLLFRRKSPIVYFSTLRFIKTSLQHTAARRRVQKWVLLSIRMLLLALMIIALAQPFKLWASNWGGGSGGGHGRSGIAAIVIDTSYSMQLEGQQIKLLDKAESIVQDLLRGTGSERPNGPPSLKEAKIAIFKSNPAPDNKPESFQPAADLLSQWTPLQPEPSPLPLAQRVSAAIDLLARSKADQKMLIVISDTQSREFIRPIQQWDAADPQKGPLRTVFFDLHPDKADSAGITSLKMDPEQPIPGVGSQAVVEVAGRAGDANKVVTLKITTLAGKDLVNKPPTSLAFGSNGKAQVRIDVKEGLPSPTDASGKPERFLLVHAELPKDQMHWDDARDLLVELPPRQSVTAIDSAQQPTAARMLRLSLDPWEGKDAAWPLVVKSAGDFSGDEHVAILMLTSWPDENRALRLADFARAGNTLVLFIQPGLEQSWAKLPERQKILIQSILPAAPMTNDSPSGDHRASPAADDLLMQGLNDKSMRINDITVRRFVPFNRPTDSTVTTLLSLSPAIPIQGSRTYSLLSRRTIGGGTIFVWSTIPDARLATHPVFLPLMVRMSLRASQGDAQNLDLGQPLTLRAKSSASVAGVQVVSPDGSTHEFQPNATGAGNPFRWDEKSNRLLFTDTTAPGLYYWRRSGSTSPLAVANVQLPAGEAELEYKPAELILKPGPDTIIARSYEEFALGVSQVQAPNPKWSGLIALMLLLLCFEALLGSVSTIWKPASWRSFVPKMGAPQST